MTETDLELLKRYTRERTEDAFTEIVRRHLDLVYSAALRQVRSPQLAEEIAQSAFTDLARNASRLKPDTVLAAWLYQVARRTAIDVVRREARRQLREQIASEMNATCATDANWTHVEPLLDEAMAALDDTDRAAVLLRFFENKSLREVGQQLGVSDDAAQKRVSRAVERLREFLAQRGVTVGASGLAVLLAANAVQSAPVGLAVTISAAATLAGTAVVATATAAATKAIAMTTLQKTLITAAFLAAVSTGIYEASQASTLRQQVRTLQQQQAPLAAQINQLTRGRDELTRQLATLRDDNERLNRDHIELLRLRGEVTQLQEASRELEQLKEAQKTDLPWVEVLQSRVARLKKLIEQMPDKSIPELEFLTDQDWLNVAINADLNTEAGTREALSQLRKSAKMNFAPTIWQAWNRFMLANTGVIPSDVSQLKPYFESGVDDKILQRYQIVAADQEDDFSMFGGKWVITEKAPVDDTHDFRVILSTKGNVGAVAFRSSER